MTAPARQGNLGPPVHGLVRRTVQPDPELGGAVPRIDTSGAFFRDPPVLGARLRSLAARPGVVLVIAAGRHGTDCRLAAFSAGIRRPEEATVRRS